MNKLLKFYFVSIFAAYLLLNLAELDHLGKKIILNNKFYPSDHELLKRTFPHFDYDKDAYKDAITEIKELKKSKKIYKNNNVERELEFVGPINIGGRIVDIEFNPKNPSIVYAAAATGGVFKSLDMGESWFPIFDEQPSLSIGDIGIDPNNPEIIYIGTGEANGGHNNFPGTGIYKSLDGGSNWEFIGLDSTVSIGRIIVDPANSSKIFVAAVGSYFTPNPQRGVYLSTDGGENWEKSLFVSDSTGAIDLVINHSNTDIIYAAMWERVRRPVFRSGTHLYGPSGGIFKSLDGGKTWDKLGNETGLPDPNNRQIGRIGLTISKSNPQVLYALFNDGSSPYGLYKTENGGDSWVETNTMFKGSGGFSWYFGQVRVDPLNHETVYVLDVPLFKSTNSGLSWDFTYGYSGPYHLHVDHHALAFHPDNPNYLISGNDGGINISQDGGITWSQPANLPITQFYEIGLDKSNPERYYGGTQDNNTIRTLTGKYNDWESIFGGDGFYVLVDPNNPDIIYAESQFGGLGKSTDGGSIFSTALSGIDFNEPTNWSTPVIMDPNNSNVLYYGTHTIYRTENGADSWDAISPKLTDHSDDRRIGTITTIAVAPTNSNVIYAGTDDGYVWVSADYGVNWNNISAELPLRWVTRVVADPTNENIVYATYSGLRWADPESRVFRSTNMGKSWNDISSNLPDAPVNAFEVDKNNTDILYLGNDVGAFISKNAGESWEILDENLPIVVVNDMKIHPTDNYLAIGTHGRGMYKLDLNNLAHSETANNYPTRLQLFQNYPNPFNAGTVIEYSVPSSPQFLETGSTINLKIYDNLGREVTTLVDENKKPGNYKAIWNAGNNSSGIYFCKLAVDNKVQTRKMLLLK